jgi:hypothetical protein
MCERLANTSWSISALTDGKDHPVFRHRVPAHAPSVHRNLDQQHKQSGTPAVCGSGRKSNVVVRALSYWTDVVSFTNTPFPKRPPTQSTNSAAAVDIHRVATLKRKDTCPGFHNAYSIPQPTL